MIVNEVQGLAKQTAAFPVSLPYRGDETAWLFGIWQVCECFRITLAKRNVLRYDMLMGQDLYLLWMQFYTGQV